jgi:hypothetical protein
VFFIAGSAEGFDFGAGAAVSYGLSLTNDTLPGLSTDNYSVNHLVLGVYFDATFARFTFMYMTNLGNGSPGAPFTGHLTLTQLGGTLIFKVPIVIKSLTLWSGVGAGFVTTLMFDTNGDGINDVSGAPDNLYVMMALGGEIKIARLITIGPCFTLNYGFPTSQPATDPPGSTHTKIFLQFTMTVGFAF